MAIEAEETVELPVTGGWVLKTAPMIQRNMDMRATPMRRGLFLPNLSTPKAMNAEVATILTIP